MGRPHRLWLAALATTWIGCAPALPALRASLSAQSEEDVWKLGVHFLEEERWVQARQQLERIGREFPTGRRAADARLAIADSWFLQGDDAGYARAEVEYEAFLALYPAHARSGYARFQLAEGAFRQRRPPDRDQAATRRALERFSGFVDAHPDSPLVGEAWQRIMACRRDLATAELLAARFYQDDRGVCEGAVARYQEVLVDYPDFEAEEEVLSRLARCLVALGRPGEAAIYRARLKRDHPEGGPASGRGGPPPEAEPPPVRLASLRPAPPPPAPPPAVEPPPPPPAREEAPLPELTQAEVDRRGIALLNAGSFAEAIEHYRRALAHYPALASRLSNLVAIYTRSGHYEIAYCLAPDDPATRLAWEEHARPRSGLCAETR